MKAFLKLISLALLTSVMMITKEAAGQSESLMKSDVISTPVFRCTRSLTQAREPLLVIISHNKSFIADSLNTVSFIKADWITKCNIYKSPQIAAIYGSQAKNGLIEVIIDDFCYPKVYHMLKTLARKHMVLAIKGSLWIPDEKASRFYPFVI